MAETANIAKIAELAFKEIFDVFGWQIQGVQNENFPCHMKHKSGGSYGTHPSDAVYWYVDPYGGHRVYVHLDLKSYSASTLLSKSDLGPALRKICDAVECASSSPVYSERYFADQPGELVSLLFIYNHDGAYGVGKFASALSTVEDSALSPPEGSRACVIGPDQIARLLSIATQIQIFDGKLKTHRRAFHHPNLVGCPSDNETALSLEDLLGPWLVVRYSGAKEGKPEVLYKIFCTPAIGEQDEFEHMIDFCFRFQLLEEFSSVELNVYAEEAPPGMQARFENAKTIYAARFLKLKEMQDKLNRIEMTPMQRIRAIFSQEKIGMTRD